MPPPVQNPLLGGAQKVALFGRPCPLLNPALSAALNTPLPNFHSLLLFPQMWCVVFVFVCFFLSPLGSSKRSGRLWAQLFRTTPVQKARPAPPRLLLSCFFLGQLVQRFIRGSLASNSPGPPVWVCEASALIHPIWGCASLSPNLSLAILPHVIRGSRLEAGATIRHLVASAPWEKPGNFSRREDRRPSLLGFLGPWWISRRSLQEKVLRWGG